MDDLEDAARFYIADRAIVRLLTPTDGPLAGCRMHLYVYDDAARLLLPVFEPEERRGTTQGWRTGSGAVGHAFEQGEYVLAVGNATSDSTFQLNDEEQKRYEYLTAAVATPVFNAADECIAVLSASTGVADHPMTTKDGEAAMVALAAGMARILVDLLKWFDDGDGR